MLPVRERMVWSAEPVLRLEVVVDAVLSVVLGIKWEALGAGGAVRMEGEGGIGPSRWTVARIWSAR